jgi:hypothetical protein
MTVRIEALPVGLDAAPAAAPPITATRTLPHAPATVFAFLADLEKHWRLTDRYLHLDEIAPDGRGARISIRSPIGLRRTARTEVTTVVAPERFGGIASVGRRTAARVVWHVQPHEDGARVELEATVLEASPGDRLLLALGGRPWLRRRFEVALARLATELGTR